MVRAIWRIKLFSTGGAYMRTTLLDDAELVNDPETKRIMFDIAEGYDRLAERAAERIADRTPNIIQ